MESNLKNTIPVEIPNYSGPLEVLLNLAKAQKVDLTKISITKLADQFLEYIKQAKNLNLELREKLKNSRDRTEEKEFVEKGKIVAEKYKTLKNEVNVSKEMLNEFKFMKKVNSVEQLKKIIKTKG